MNPLTLKHTMLAPFESFEKLGVVGKEADSKYPGRHIYIDRGSSVLAVAHLDSVKVPKFFWCNNKVIACPSIDNRLGAWIILHGLPSMGIYPDVLLTENEESCNSTGEDFQPGEVKWNWMFSFDRMNEDVVLYQYGGGKLQEAIKSHGFAIGNGSYSDISSMGSLEIEGANFGCGMEDYHSDNAHAKVDVVIRQLQKFAALWKSIEHTKFTWDEKSSWHRKSKRHQWNGQVQKVYPGYGDDMFGYGEDYYRNRNTVVPGGVTPTRKDILVAGLRRDIDRCNRLAEDGFGKFLDYEESPQAWRDYNNMPDEAKAKHNWFECRDCGGYYEYKDGGEWSAYYGKTFCKACWLERMDILDLLPPSWLREIEAVTLRERVEEKEKVDVNV